MQSMPTIFFEWQHLSNGTNYVECPATLQLYNIFELQVYPELGGEYTIQDSVYCMYVHVASNAALTSGISLQIPDKSRSCLYHLNFKVRNYSMLRSSL